MPLLYQEEIIFLLAIEIGLSNGMDRKVYRSVEHLNFIGAYLSPSSWAWFDICSGSTYRLAETHNNLDTPNTYSLAASPPARWDGVGEVRRYSLRPKKKCKSRFPRSQTILVLTKFI